ncbi:MAG: cytochrome c [Rhizobiales bacterium]|nr:cytochrome c [Hyphomicrobiales bacterium]
MIRPLVAVIALAVGATVVIAQQNPIEARKNLMKGNSAQARIGAAMAKGEAPFDLAKAKQVFQVYQETAAKFGDLFPANSKSGGETSAAPKVWEDMAGFKAQLAKFGADAKAAEAAVKDLDSFKAQFGDVAKNCGGCHRDYRVRRS